MENQKVGLPGRMWLASVKWMDDRFQLSELLAASVHVHIPKKAKTYYLGGITLFIFMSQVITGSLLSLYYQPTPDTAYDSVLFITSSVQFGWLIRSIHAWGANLMVIFCLLHLLRVYFQGVYKRPREITWAVGVILLCLTLGFGFTGYLLPWDEIAYWATTVGSESASAVPLIGEQLLLMMRGGPDVTDATLTRFYGAHTILLPLATAGLLGVHLLLIHQQGIADPTKAVKWPPNETEAEEQQETEQEVELESTTTAIVKKEEVEESKPFFPNYVLSEAVAWYFIIGILVILASIFPIGLEEKANPLETPLHIKPEWYFLAVYQFLKLVPRVVGVLAPMLAIPILMLLPFIDTNPEVHPRKRPVAIILGIVVLIVMAAFTVWGKVS